MTNEDLIWVKLANESIKRNLDTGPGCRTWRDWSPAEGLLLDNLSVVGSPLLRDLSRGLFEGHNSLCFECDRAGLPALAFYS